MWYLTMMKNTFLFLIIAAMICFMLVGCGNNVDDRTTLSTVPTNTVEITDQQTVTQMESQEENLDISQITYIQFNAMSAEEQQTIMDSFPSNDDFFLWYSSIKKIHDDFQDKLKPQPSTGHESESEHNQEATANDPDLTDAPTTGDPNETEVPSVSNPQVSEMTFMQYHNLSATEQKAFINSFETIDDFVAWHDAAEKEYNSSLPELDGTTPIDLEDYLN